jgi:Cutinase
MLFGFSGYSQGADVTHHAFQNLTEYADRFSSIVMFGDPLTSVGWPSYYSNRVLNTCDPGDRSCGGKGTAGHLKYGADGNDLVKVAANWITTQFKKGAPKPIVGAKALKALPTSGDAAAFLDTAVTWPPVKWATEYTDGIVMKPIGLSGTANLVSGTDGSVTAVKSGYGPVKPGGAKGPYGF